MNNLINSKDESVCRGLSLVAFLEFDNKFRVSMKRKNVATDQLLKEDHVLCLGACVSWCSISISHIHVCELREQSEVSLLRSTRVSSRTEAIVIRFMIHHVPVTSIQFYWW